VQRPKRVLSNVPLILRACLRGSSQTSRLPKSDKKETAPIRSTKSCGERLIKTLFKKIVHNKNDIFHITPAIRAFLLDLPAMRLFIEPPIHKLTGQAGFLQAHAISSKR
jgi:hypothetical protein